MFRRALVALWLAAALVAVSGILSLRPAVAQPLELLKIVTSPIDAGFEVYYAQQLGFFKKYGLDVQISELASGPASAAAVASGQMDIGLSNLLSLASAHAHGAPFVLVMPAGLYSSTSPTAGLVILDRAPLHVAKDLDGKTIGVNALKSISQIAPQAWIDRNGGDSSTAKFVEVQQSLVPQALLSGRIDAALLNEPDLSSVLLDKNYRVIAPVFSAIADSFVINAWFSTGDWAKAHPETVRKFVAAMQETARWANAHQRETEAILREHSKARVVPGMRRAVFEDRFDPARLQPLIDAGARYKVIDAAFSVTDLIYTPLPAK